jgi:vancomycin permeability regulator SanA
MRAYLVKKGWPAEQIKMDPRGYNSISDTVYALGLVEGGDKVIAVTAWYHAFRVWLIWLRLGRLVGVGISWKTYPWTNPLREFLALTKTIVVLAFGQLKPRFS